MRVIGIAGTLGTVRAERTLRDIGTVRVIGTVGTLGTAKDDEILRDVGTVRAIGTVGLNLAYYINVDLNIL